MRVTVSQKRRGELIDVREQRFVPTDRVELRADASGNTLTLTGYAATFEPYEMYGGPTAFGWVEQMDRCAFDKTLREKPDLHLLINHAGMPLARTKSGTLQLAIDDRGLKVTAQLDRSDPDVQRLETKMRRGDMDEMSFAFRVKAQRWSAAPGSNDPQSHRLITEVSLHKGDVSVVNFGANPTTAAELLGRRRKQENGMRKTLSLSEAQAIVLADEKRMPRSRLAPVAGRSVVSAQREADADAAAWKVRAAASDAITRRAAELLAACGLDRPLASGEHAVANLVRNYAPAQGFSAVIMPPAGMMLQAAAQDELRARRETRLAELDRQRDALTRPEVPLWPYGGPPPHSVALK